MNGLCNINNVVYQGIIYPKDYIIDRKTDFLHKMEREVRKSQIFFLSRTSKKPNNNIEAILEFEK